MLRNIGVVLFKPKFSTNIGSVARICANMGVNELILVDPPDYDPVQAGYLATSQGLEILQKLKVKPDLPSALADFHEVFAATARMGGWRKAIMLPEEAAKRIAIFLTQSYGKNPEGLKEEPFLGPRAALLFGPEDRGLSNEETKLCPNLVTIPTTEEATSLNLSHAVAIFLYECHRAKLRHLSGVQALSQELPATEKIDPESEQSTTAKISNRSDLSTQAQKERLFEHILRVLIAIDYMKDDNHDYWMLPIRRFLARAPLRRYELSLLMGICRKILWACGKPILKSKGKTLKDQRSNN